MRGLAQRPHQGVHQRRPPGDVVLGRAAGVHQLHGHLGLGLRSWVLAPVPLRSSPLGPGRLLGGCPLGVAVLVAVLGALGLLPLAPRPLGLGPLVWDPWVWDPWVWRVWA